MEDVEDLAVDFEGVGDHVPEGFVEAGACGGEEEGAEAEESFADGEDEGGVLDAFERGLEDDDAEDA